MKNITVVKLGGNAMDDETQLGEFLVQFSEIPGGKLLVHGGGKPATELAAKLGFRSTMNNGRRVTDEQMLEVVTMTYAGLLNKKLVAKLQALGCNALGLSGVDGNLVQSEKRLPLPFDYGLVGDPVSVNSALLHSLIVSEFVPVIAPITHDAKGQLLNTNADTVAAVIASSLTGSFNVQLVYAFDKHGVMADVNDDFSVIDRLSQEEFMLLQKSGKIHCGMLPKLEAGFKALRNNVSRVTVKHLQALHEEKATELVL